MTLAAICCLLFASGQNEEIDRLTVQLTYQNQDSAKVDTSLLLISKLIDLEDYTKAFLYVNQTIDLSKKLNYKRGLADANFYKAVIYNKRNDYFNALDNFEKSKSFYTTINDTLGIARVSSRIGLIEIKKGNYQKGLKYSLSAISIFENQNLSSELSDVYSSLSEAYLKTNYIDKSLEFSQKALNVKKFLRDSTGIKVTTLNIAHLYSMRKEHRKAIEYYEKALNLLNEETDQKLKGEILPRLGNEYLMFNEFDKATNYLLQGLEYNRKEENEEGLAIVLNGLGNLNIQRKKLKLAENQLLEAYTYAHRNELTQQLIQNYKLRISLDSTRGYFQNAFKWQSEYYKLLEKAKSKDIQKPIEDLDFDINSSGQPASETVIRESSENLNSGNTNYWLYGLGLLLAITAIALFILAEQNSKVRAQFSKLESSIQNSETRNKNLEDHVKDLEEINQVKDKLFSIVSHDLKDSISSIKAFLDLLKDDSISQEEFNELIPELSENADNASSLLYNLLNWSKSQLQSLEPKPELFDIQEVFRNKMDLVEQKIEIKNIILIDESQSDMVYADKSMIEIVIQNLITNAVKFSRNNDMITISNHTKNGKAILCVEDTGVGISKENLSKLFNAAKNFTTVGTKNEKGTGLGLSIAKDLVELNQGKIWVESTVNVGSKFFIELPKKQS